MFKKLKIKLTARLILSVLGAVFTMSVILLISIGLSSSSKAKEAGIKLAISKSEQAASQVKILLNQPIDAAHFLTESILGMLENGSKNRETVEPLLARLVKNNSNFYAAWVQLEQNKFDNDAKYRTNSKYSKVNGAFNLTYYKNKDKIESEASTLDMYQADWYLAPIANKNLTLTQPYNYSYSGEVTDSIYETSVVLPIFKNNILLGAVGIDLSLASLGEICKSNALYETGFATILTDKLNFASHPNVKKNGSSMTTETKGNIAEIKKHINEGKTYYYEDISTESGKEILRCFAPITVDNNGRPWAVMVEIPMSEIMASSRALISFILLIGILSMLAMTVLIYFIAKSIITPIQKGIQFAEAIANGNLNATLAIEDREDEIGDLKFALQFMSAKLKSIITDVVENSLNIVAASRLLNSTSMDLSSGANEQASANEEIAANMEEMTSNINQNSENSSQTERIAVQAAQDIEEARIAVTSTIEAMTKIAEKITIIGEIAEKTDLLAINAAIEAARAGEQGKGFAVVANEIRKLAERSQNAANQIEELTRTSVKIADKSGEALTKLVPDIKKTAQLVQEISVSSLEQNSGANQINTAILQLNSVTQRNASVAEEMASSSEELFAQAEQLQETISFYQIEETGNTKNATTIADKLQEKIKNTSKAIFSMKSADLSENEIHLNKGKRGKNEDYDKF